MPKAGAAEVCFVLGAAPTSWTAGWLLFGEVVLLTVARALLGDAFAVPCCLTDDEVGPEPDDADVSRLVGLPVVAVVVPVGGAGWPAGAGEVWCVLGGFVGAGVGSWPAQMAA